jgi:hypothetical protein
MMIDETLCGNQKMLILDARRRIQLDIRAIRSTICPFPRRLRRFLIRAIRVIGGFTLWLRLRRAKQSVVRNAG